MVSIGRSLSLPRALAQGLAVPLLMLVLTLACSRPVKSEPFVRNAGSGRYGFSVDMSDSLCTFDLSFYASLPVRNAPSGFPLKVYMTSPGGQVYCESVYFDATGSVVKPWRTGLVPVEYGVWNLELMTDETRIYGLGLVCEKKIRDGAR